MLDFSKMKWRLREHQPEDLFRMYPDLEQIYYEVKMLAQPKHDGLTPQELMALMVWVYHIKSPLVHEPSMHKRRTQALGLIGYVIETQDDLARFNHLAQYIVGANSFANRLSVHFCKFEEVYDWLELCQLQDMLDDIALSAKEEQSGTEKKSANEILKVKVDIYRNAEPIRKRVQELSQKIFRNDVDLLNYASSHVILEQRKPLISPERIVANNKTKQYSKAS